MLKQYMAPQGTVWDQISFLHYNDEGFIGALLEANPLLRHIVQFEKPTTVNIPDKPVISSASADKLPPWKQGA